MCQLLGDDLAGKLEQAVEIEHVTYCTSMVSDRQAKSRQDTYLQALSAVRPEMRVLLGRYDERTQHCGVCDNAVGFPKEKQTDVNLAVAMVSDACLPENRRPEVQLLVTGDTDLLPAMRASRAVGVRVAVASPPARGRTRETMQREADNYQRVFKRHLRNSPLPGLVYSAVNDYPLTPPGSWVHPDDW
jgi:hypothetical protein